MIDNWAEVRRRRLVRLRAGAIAGIAVVVALGVVVGSVRRTDSTPVEAKAPGFREQEASVDTSPFSLARPQSDGPTTLPEAMFEPGVPTTAPTTSPPTTTTTTTTTLPPTTTTLPIPDRQDDPICDAFVELISFARASQQSLDEPHAFAQQVSERVTEWIGQLRAIDAQTYAGAISRLEEVRVQLRDRPTADGLRVILSNLTAPDARTEPLRAHAMEACPQVLAAR